MRIASRSRRPRLRRRVKQCHLHPDAKLWGGGRPQRGREGGLAVVRVIVSRVDRLSRRSRLPPGSSRRGHNWSATFLAVLTSRPSAQCRYASAATEVERSLALIPSGLGDNLFEPTQLARPQEGFCGRSCSCQLLPPPGQAGWKAVTLPVVLALSKAVLVCVIVSRECASRVDQDGLACGVGLNNVTSTPTRSFGGEVGRSAAGRGA